jgi:hypothetical protein
MLIEINIGLLGAIAIVASLLSAVFETKFYNRWASYAVVGFGISGILSTIILFDTVRAAVFNLQQESTNYQIALTYSSIFIFMVSTEILVFISFMKFWKRGSSKKGGEKI